MGQITQKHFDDDANACVKKLKDAVRYARKNIASLLFPILGKRSVRIDGYSDAAFANNKDLTSQLSRIILVIDGRSNAVPIAFKSYKSHRATISVLSAEVIEFSDLFDDAFALKSQLEHAFPRAIPMHLLTDSKSLFDIVSKGTRGSEQRIMIDIHADRKSYESEEITSIGFVGPANNLADGFTKPKMQSSLLNLLKPGKHDFECEHWILRPKPNNANV